MINLLPTDYRLHLRYGRMNARLGRWLIIGVVLIATQIVIFGAGWLYIDQEIKNLNRGVTATQAQLKEQDLEKVQKQADQISQNVLTINQILKREIRFSELMKDIGNVMPPKTVLSSLTLTKANGALDLIAGAKDYTSAAQIAVNLSDPKNELFEKVDIVSINCVTIVPGDYPCTANLTALFGKDIQSRYLNAASGNSQ